MDKKMRSFIISGMFILFGAFIYYQSLDIVKLMSNDAGSGFFPKFIAISITAIALLKIFFTFKDNKSENTQELKGDMAGGWLTIVLLAAYVFVYARVGFIISTAVYLFLQMLILAPNENRNIALFGIISASTPVIIYTLFVYLIKMPLPKGILGF
jgi:putative tricarboxylic transport membrane protein